MTVVIPVHDEAASLPGVLAGLARLDPPPAVLVVDDGSTDGSAERAAAVGATVLRHGRRRGQGAALRTGLAAVREGVVVLLDGDGQHDPAWVPALVERLAEGADLAVAARRSFADCGPLRRVGNQALAALASCATGVAVPDLTSGCRAARRADLEPWLPLLPTGFSTPTTTTLAFLHSGRRVDFLSVPGRPRRHGVTRTRLLRDGLFCLRVGLKVSTLLRPRRLALAAALGALLTVGVGLVAELPWWGTALALPPGSLVLGGALALARGAWLRGAAAPPAVLIVASPPEPVPAADDDRASGLPTAAGSANPTPSEADDRPDRPAGVGALAP